MNQSLPCRVSGTRSTFLKIAGLSLSLACLLTGMPANGALAVSNDAFLLYDDSITTLYNFERSAGTDSVDIALGTTVNVDGIFNDLILFQMTQVTSGQVTLNETITNTGSNPWHEWAELPSTLITLGGPQGTATWDSFDSVAFDSNPARPGTWDQPAELSISDGLVFYFDSPLLPGESFSVEKVLNYTGVQNDPDGGVQVLAFGAALPLPPSVALLGSAILGLGLARRRRPQE